VKKQRGCQRIIAIRWHQDGKTYFRNAVAEAWKVVAGSPNALWRIVQDAIRMA